MTTGWEDDFDVLPDTTADEDAEGWSEVDDGSSDDRLIEERPPHWDDPGTG